MHLILTERGNEPFLTREIERAFRSARVQTLAPGLVEYDGVLQPEAPPCWVFARQVLPNSGRYGAASISAWTEHLTEAVVRALPESQPWQLHVVAHYGTSNAGEHRCELIRQSVRDALKRRHRQLLRSLRPGPHPFGPDDSLVQLLLTSPEAGFISVSPAPLPHALRRMVWPFPKGEIPVAIDKAAPSRAFAKLLEAEMRFGQSIASGEWCVDLGASPGSWSYVALQRGARVTAVDRSPLRADLMSDPHLVFQRGDAFTYEPPSPVNWLLCDVIAAPARNVELLLQWLRGGLTRHFVVTLKFKGHEEYSLLEHLKHALPGLCEEFYLVHLCANKNEVCAFGTARLGRVPLSPTAD